MWTSRAWGDWILYRMLPNVYHKIINEANRTETNMHQEKPNETMADDNQKHTYRSQLDF